MKKTKDKSLKIKGEGRRAEGEGRRAVNQNMETERNEFTMLKNYGSFFELYCGG